MSRSLMIEPGITELSKHVDSRYTLVSMAAKRARMIGETGEGTVPCESNKAVSIAVAEIADNLVGYVRHEKQENE
jgi:DNA-directed RNA polymerase subunit omega